MEKHHCTSVHTCSPLGRSHCVFAYIFNVPHSLAKSGSHHFNATTSNSTVEDPSGFANTVSAEFVLISISHESCPPLVVDSRFHSCVTHHVRSIPASIVNATVTVSSGDSESL